jgi:predicted TIM-barrel fold metal-dependent hydrolase
VTVRLDDSSTANVSGRRSSKLLPDPERRVRKYTLFSADDHLVEPPHAFEGRVEAKFADRAPKVIELDSGAHAWLYDGNVLPNVAFNAVVGRERATQDGQNFDPMRFDEMRTGAYDIHARIRDMNLDGVYASVNFPSALTGFGGVRLQTTTQDRELALAVVRAYNQWHLEEWAGSYPDRIIPCQIPWLFDPEIAAEEIRRNAALGFKAVTFPESPADAGLPTVHSGYWDPFLRACAETETVVCLHTGSSGHLPNASPDIPIEGTGVLFGAYAVFPAVDWLYSFCVGRFPELKICLSEGGIGWVAGLLDRLEHTVRRLALVPAGVPGPYPPAGAWKQFDITPADAFRRNFWFCALDDRSSFGNADYIGEDHIMVEVDYPHNDSSWPDSQAHLAFELSGVAEDLVRKITWENASKLFRHPVPDPVQDDPDAF